MAVYGSKGAAGSLAGAPAMVTGKPGRSTPVAGSTPCRYQCGCRVVGPSFAFAVKYTARDTGS